MAKRIRNKKPRDETRGAEDLTREVLPDVETRNTASRRALYKPDYARVQRMVLLRRISGIALVICIVGILVAVLFMWGIPAIQNALAAPTATPAPTAAPDASPTPEVVVYDEATGLPIYDNALNLLVINEDHPATAEDVPPLTEAAGVSVHESIVPALELLLSDAEAAGFTITLASGFVSYEEQSVLYDAVVERLIRSGDTKVMAAQNAKEITPAPGECDLQTGLCVTVSGRNEAFAATDAYAWLHTNAAAYGFVQRYPEGKERYTGVESSSLVLRYVGTENALAMRRLSMCLEEYITYVG